MKIKSIIIACLGLLSLIASGCILIPISGTNIFFCTIRFINFCYVLSNILLVLGLIVITAEFIKNYRFIRLFTIRCYITIRKREKERKLRNIGKIRFSSKFKSVKLGDKVFDKFRKDELRNIALRKDKSKKKV